MHATILLFKTQYTHTHRTPTVLLLQLHTGKSQVLKSLISEFHCLQQVSCMWLRKKKQETKTAGKKNSRSPLHGLEDLITTHYCLSIIYHCTAQYWEGAVGQRTSCGCTVPIDCGTAVAARILCEAATPL